MLRDVRLACIASMVRQGSRVADIGTDHAHLPVALVQSGVSPFAVACDLRAGPLENARRSVEEAGLSDRIDCRLGDGLSPVRAGEVDEIVIAGMGGETITAILEACPWAADEAYRLLLQPMTRAEELRKYLMTHGFELVSETVVEDAPHLYTVMEARFTGAAPVREEACWYRGALQGADGMRYLHWQTGRLRERLHGLQSGGGREEECARLRALLEKLEGEL